MLQRILSLSVASIALAVTAACAAPPPPGTTSTNRAVITDAEIPTTGVESAYDMVQRLRPEYLRVKPTQTYMSGNTAAPPPSVILNGQRFGELADLRQILASSLSEVRYYTIEEGKRKFGMQYGGGVIEISYRAR